MMGLYAINPALKSAQKAGILCQTSANFGFFNSLLWQTSERSRKPV